MKRAMLVEAPIKVKAYEIDAMGIVSNIHYIKWFEDMRHVFLDKYYPYEEMMEVNISPVLLKTEAEYKHHLTIQDNPCGRCWVSKLGGFKWEFQFEIFQGDTIHCSGVQRGGFLDIKKQRPVPCPERIMEHYQADIGVQSA